MAEIEPILDDAARDILATAIVGAFSASELWEAVLRDLELNIHVIVGDPDAAIEVLARGLMDALTRRGLVVQFFRAARKRRPDNAPLIAAIQQFCPLAIQDEPPADASVLDVIDALERIRVRLADPVVAAAVNDSRAELGTLQSGLVRLRIYKSLHDLLQTLQVSQFSLLTDYIRQLRTVPEAAVTLGNLLLGLKMAFTTARGSLGPLEDTSDHGEETRWIDIIYASLETIGKARDSLDDDMARRATLMIRSQLQSEPSRINSRLRKEALKLPLTRLSEAIASASETKDLTKEQRSAFKNGVDSVTELRMRLQRRIADHDRWQSIEGPLWFLDDVVAHSETPIDPFKDYWLVTKEIIQPLWSADVKADWVIATQECGAKIDAALKATPPATSLAKSEYLIFRSQALWQFFLVDRDLSNLCEHVLRIGAPVASLLKGNG